MDYPSIIAPERRSRETPAHLVENGKAVFGTFDREFQDIDLLSIRHPTGAPDCFKRLKLTLWEATEVHLEEGVLLAVCCDMGIFGQIMHVFYDKRKRKVISWTDKVKSADVTVARNLIHGSKTFVKPSETLSIAYTNEFQDGKCALEGYHNGPAGHIDYAFSLSRLSLPSVVSIPFSQTRNRPLYSQKDFFRCEGTLSINGETFHATEASTAIVDDHKGYYPRHAHYDWLTTMGREADGGHSFAFNLTANQSVDPERYNENLIWLEGETSLLPPVRFSRNIPTIRFQDGAEWTVRDAYGMVDVHFHVYDIFRMETHVKPLVNIEYFVAFGELSGYLLDEKGKKYVLDGMMGMGEDKDLLL